MLISCAISASLGTRRPVDALSALPVSSFTHSLTTEAPDPSSPFTTSGLEDGGAGRAVVIGSASERPGAARSSGHTRFVRRGGRVEPTRGNR